MGFTNGTLLRNGSPIMEEWNVQSFGFGVDGAEAFAEAMRFNPNLKTLVLFNDNLGDAGAAAIVKGLRDNNIALVGLYLGDNQIGDTGAAALAEYMRDSTTLRVLDLGFNRFGDAGAAAFAEGLRGNTALKELKLHHTRIGDAGAWALVESVKGNTALQYLQLHRTQISEGSKERKSCLPFLRKPAAGKHALQAAWESTRKEAGSNLIQLEL
jgi:Ran GTPase-activating protein (RanGAP) involved in mRNA processing and transport